LVAAVQLVAHIVGVQSRIIQRLDEHVELADGRVASRAFGRHPVDTRRNSSTARRRHQRGAIFVS
jgi:hypothetical protein